MRTSRVYILLCISLGVLSHIPPNCFQPTLGPYGNEGVGQSFSDMQILTAMNTTADMEISSALICSNEKTGIINGFQFTLKDSKTNVEKKLSKVGVSDDPDSTCKIFSIDIANNYLVNLGIGYDQSNGIRGLELATFNQKMAKFGSEITNSSLTSVSIGLEYDGTDPTKMIVGFKGTHQPTGSESGNRITSLSVILMDLRCAQGFVPATETNLGDKVTKTEEAKGSNSTALLIVVIVLAIALAVTLILGFLGKLSCKKRVHVDIEEAYTSNASDSGKKQPQKFPDRSKELTKEEIKIKKEDEESIQLTGQIDHALKKFEGNAEHAT